MIRNKQRNKFIIPIILFVILLILSATDTFILKGATQYTIYKKIKELTTDDIIEEFKPMDSSFTPIEVGHILLRPINGNLIEGNLFPLINRSFETYQVLINVPIPFGYTMLNTYDNFTYSSDNSFCILFQETTKEFTEDKVVIRNFGFKDPVIIEVQFKSTKLFLSIHCYTPDILYFYKNYDWFNSNTTISNVTFSNTFSEFEDVLYKEELSIPIEYKNKIIDDETTKLFINMESYSYYSYYRGIGFFNVSLLWEVERLIQLGYGLESITKYSDGYVINFYNGVTLVGIERTTNSFYMLFNTNI